MSILIQHGYGKSDKITRALDANYVNGVILNPSDELPDNLDAFIQDLTTNYKPTYAMLDSMFYLSNISPIADKKLPRYPFYKANLDRASFANPKNIRDYVTGVIDYQCERKLSHIITPTILFGSFDDPFSQISLSLGLSSIDYYADIDDDRPLLMSLVFNEAALSSRDNLENYLDILTTLNVDGFYIVVNRIDNKYNQQFESSELSNLMQVVYALGVLNDYEIIMGYTDILSILFHAVGASATCCGWYQGLRKFSLRNLTPKTGGKRGLPRYTSLPLLNSILVLELSNIEDEECVKRVISDTEYDQEIRINPGEATWPDDISALHHWCALNNAINDMLAYDDISDRLEVVSEKISYALALYGDIDRLGVQFNLNNGPKHLNQWVDAIKDFRNETGVL